MCVLLLTGPDLPEVELEARQRQIFQRGGRRTYLELLALEDVAISAARLPWPAADASVETARSELGLKKRVDLGVYGSTK